MENSTDEANENTPSKNTFAGAYIIFALTLLCGLLFVLYGILPVFISLSVPGAPDTMQLSRGINVVIYGHFAMVPLLITSLIFEGKLQKNPHDLKPSLWYCMLATACVSLLCLSIINLPLSIVFLVRLFRNKKFYFQKNAEA